MTENNIPQNKELNIWEALIPVVVLVILLAFNVYVFKDDAVAGSNQFILLLGGATAAIVGLFNKVKFDSMTEAIAKNIKSVSGAIIILLLVGSLAASWLISGIIPTMIFYGIKLLNPTFFLPAAVIISAIISIATGSSWNTSATIGIALVAIGKVMGLPMGMVAGAVISGAYFGDKMSPLSDTTNLAAAMAGADLFKHIRYMAYTTVPSIIITLIIFTFLGVSQETSSIENTQEMLQTLDSIFHISPWLFLIPIIVIVLIVKKTNPMAALLIGTLLGCLAALIAQPELIESQTKGLKQVQKPYYFLMKSIAQGVNIDAPDTGMNELFSANGMKGMLSTVWLIICAMVFGGIMEAIGALSRISKALLSVAKSVFGLFASTVASCLALNVTASDQYLAIVVPGKMFEKAYKDKGLAPENLSRTLEDSGTVTSVLIPWNTCGAYQSGVLGVTVSEYIGYAIFNYLSPFMTLIFALLRIKIKQLSKAKKAA